MERSFLQGLTELFTGDTASEERNLSLEISKKMLIKQLQNALRNIVIAITSSSSSSSSPPSSPSSSSQEDQNKTASSPDPNSTLHEHFNAPLQDQSPGVQQLLTLIEACFSHGLKPKNDVIDAHKNDYPLDYWDFICTLRASSDGIANATLDMIATTTYVRSTYGRCRAWLRKLINQKALEYNVRTLTSDVNIAKMWYYDQAIMADIESASLFTSMMAALNEIGFELTVDDALLENIVPVSTICVVVQSGVKEVNTAYRTSSVRDGVARFENDRGLEIFRSEINNAALNAKDKQKQQHKGTDTTSKRWFIGDPNRRVAVFYANTSTNQPPHDGWIVHSSGGTAPTPKVVTFQVPSIIATKKKKDIGNGVEKSTSDTTDTTIAVLVENEKKKEKANENEIAQNITDPGDLEDTTIVAVVENEIKNVESNHLNALKNEVIHVSINTEENAQEKTKVPEERIPETKQKQEGTKETKETKANRLQEQENDSASIDRRLNWDNTDVVRAKLPLPTITDSSVSPSKRKKKKKKTIALIDDDHATRASTQRSLKKVTERAEKKRKEEQEEVRIARQLKQQNEIMEQEKEKEIQRKKQQEQDKLAAEMAAEKAVKEQKEQKKQKDIKERLKKEVEEKEKQRKEKEEKVEEENRKIQQEEKEESERLLQEEEEMKMKQTKILMEQMEQEKEKKEIAISFKKYDCEDENNDVEEVEEVEAVEAAETVEDIQDISNIEVAKDVKDEETTETTETTENDKTIEETKEQPALTTTPDSIFHTSKDNKNEEKKETTETKETTTKETTNTINTTAQTNTTDTTDTTDTTESSKTMEPTPTIKPTETVNEFVAERTRLQLELENLRKKRKEDAQKRLANMYYTAQQLETTQNEPVVISEQDHSVASMKNSTSLLPQSLLTSSTSQNQNQNQHQQQKEEKEKVSLSPSLLPFSPPSSPHLIPQVISSPQDPWLVVDETVTSPSSSTVTSPSSIHNWTPSTPSTDTKIFGPLASIDVHVIDYQMNTVPKPHVTYQVRVREKRSRRGEERTVYIVSRRYTQFKELHSFLKKNVKKSNIKLPNLPTQGWRRSFSSEHIDKRRTELNQYVIDLMDVLKGEQVTLIMTQPFISFLAKKNKDDQNINTFQNYQGPKKRQGNGIDRNSNGTDPGDSGNGTENGSHQHRKSSFHRQLLAAAGKGEDDEEDDAVLRKSNDPVQPLANWSGIHISLVTEIRPEPGKRGVSTKVGIGLQRFVCGTCGGRLKNEKSVRWCEYTELYHCNNCCTQRARRILPTRVLHQWDFLQYRVCDEVALFLDDVYTRPVLCVSALNPQLFDWISELRHVRLLRLQLMRMKDFVDTCRQGVELRSRLDERELGYLMDQTEFYSLRDLFEINNKELITFLMGVVEVIALHISRECAQCSARGFVCEMCDDAVPIYAFDILNVAACRGCNTFVHRTCITQKSKCRRCKRLRERKLLEASGGSMNGRQSTTQQMALGLMGDRDAPFVTQQTIKMAENEERRTRSSSKNHDQYMDYISTNTESNRQQGTNNQTVSRERMVSAGGPEEAPFVEPTNKSWHWRRGSKE